MTNPAESAADASRPATPGIRFFHAKRSRSFGILWLLEELGVDYELKLVDIRAEGGAPEAYRAIQPNKKVPAILDGDIVVTERAAIALYLTERFPDAKLAPPPGDPGRAKFISSLVYTDAVVDPALSAKLLGFQYQARDVSYGSFDDMIANVETTLRHHDYAAGDAFTAADTQLGSAVFWGLEVMKALPDRPAFRDYLKRLQERAAFQRCSKIDQDAT
jgi:glutathione S-transferase